MYDPNLHRELFHSAKAPSQKAGSQTRVDRPTKRAQDSNLKNEEVVTMVNDFTKPPEYPIFSESESQAQPFELPQTLLHSGL